MIGYMYVLVFITCTWCSWACLLYYSIASCCVADAVFESVAQVLLSRSRGLTSRFEQLVSKSDAEVS